MSLLLAEAWVAVCRVELVLVAATPTVRELDWSSAGFEPALSGITTSFTLPDVRLRRLCRGRCRLGARGDLRGGGVLGPLACLGLRDVLVDAAGRAAECVGADRVLLLDLGDLG